MIRKKIKPMCGNCVYCNDHFSVKNLNLCSKPGIQEFVDPFQTPCDFYEDWANPKYEKENQEYAKKN